MMKHQLQYEFHRNRPVCNLMCVTPLPTFFSGSVQLQPVTVRPIFAKISNYEFIKFKFTMDRAQSYHTDAEMTCKLPVQFFPLKQIKLKEQTLNIGKTMSSYNSNFVYHQGTEYENRQYKSRCRFVNQIFDLACTHQGYLPTSNHNFETHKELHIINLSTIGEWISSIKTLFLFEIFDLGIFQVGNLI